jgi:Xaa-Pro aminopeptidase
MSEFTSKLHLLRELAARHGLDAILLRRVSSFAWATCGAASYINIASTDGVASLLITLNDQYLITSNIEVSRLDKEENLAAQGWVFRPAAWFDSRDPLVELKRGLRLGSDGSFPDTLDLTDEIAHLRVDLTSEEGVRFRALGKLCAQAMQAAIQSVRPGQTEYEIAGKLAREAEKLGVQTTVNLIASDERIFNFRHPLPTAKKLERYAMLVLCGRRWGLVCSITRLVYFGKLPVELRAKAEATARVDAAFISNTRPDNVLGQVFERSVELYAQLGYPDEWHKHHQGGPAGYEPREYLATPASTEVIAAGQVYAWNPSVTGTKSEDTILVGVSGNEILTSIPGWPEITVSVGDEKLARPAILEVI